MAVLPMKTLPDPILRQKAKKVATITPAIRRLVSNMIDTMYEQGGVGLAAIQVGVLQRVIVIQLPEDEQPRVYINPKILRTEGEREVEEGCLSIPGYRGLVRRSVKIRARAQDLDGRMVRVRADELLAQALEHEVDHLDGTLYIDRLVDRDHLWKIEEEPAPSESYAG